MSDIPVGSPPVPYGRHAAPGGWYPDPLTPSQERYWDGWQWTRGTRPLASAPAPYGPPLQPGQPGPGQRQANQTADGVPLSSWGIRALAAILDMAVLYLFLSIAIQVLPGPGAQVREMGQRLWEGLERGEHMVIDLVDANQLLLVILAMVGVHFFYHLLFWGLAGRTLGMMATGQRVVPVGVGTHTGALGWRASIVRALVASLPWISLLFSPISIFDALLPLWQRQRQSLHDLAARTQVVRPPRLGP